MAVRQCKQLEVITAQCQLSMLLEYCEGCGCQPCKCCCPPSCSDGREWKRLRSALGRPVVPRKLQDQVPRLEQTAEVFLQVAMDSASADEHGYTRNAHQLLQRWAMEGEPIASVEMHCGVCVTVCVWCLWYVSVGLVSMYVCSTCVGMSMQRNGTCPFHNILHCS